MLRAAVLAGGQSSRMGRDKALMLRAGQTMLERAVALLQATGAEQVVVSGRAEHPLGVIDLEPHCGPPGALLSLLTWLHDRQALDGDPLLLIPVDMPLLTLPTLQNLLIATPVGKGARYRNEIFPCVFPASEKLYLHLRQLFLEGQQRGGQRSLRALLAFVESVEVDAAWVNPREFSNTNTPEEWRIVDGD